jgi:hypothetical protein
MKISYRVLFVENVPCRVKYLRVYRLLPQVLELIKHVLGAVVDVNLHHGRVEVLHCELFGEGAHKERLDGVDARYLVRQQGPLRFVPVLQEHKACGATRDRERRCNE